MQQALLARRPSPLVAQAKTKPSRARLVCLASASAEAPNRRALLAAALGAGSLLALPHHALATPATLDLLDARKHKTALDSFVQAASPFVDQRERFDLNEVQGLTIDDHKRRLNAAVKALEANVEPALQRKAWWRIQAGIRDYGTIRFDLDRLTANVGDKLRRRQLLSDQEEAMGALARLDFAARKEDGAKARAAYDDALGKLRGLAAALG